MGWEGGHLHEFMFGQDSYARNEPGLDLSEVMDEAHVTLREALGARKTFVYVYDYGDNWRHKVKIEDRDAGCADLLGRVHRRRERLPT